MKVKKLVKIAVAVAVAFHMVGVQALNVQRMGMVYHEALGTVALPVAYGQLRMVALLRDAPHEDGVGLRTQLMTEHLGESI